MIVEEITCMVEEGSELSNISGTILFLQSNNIKPLCKHKTYVFINNKLNLVIIFQNELCKKADDHMTK